MAHELVFQNGKALMFYVKTNSASVPWHAFARTCDSPPSAETVKKLIGATRTVNIKDLYDPETNEKLKDIRMTKDDCGRVLGFVGPDYQVLQDSFLVDSFQPWIDGKFGTFETGGLLKGGARCWVQIKLNRDPVAIEKNDHIQLYAYLAHGHDGKLGIIGGRNEVRVVCNNTLQLAMDTGSIISRKHRGNVNGHVEQIHQTMLKWEQEFLETAEKYKFLAGVPVKGEKQLAQYAQAVFGKNPDGVEVIELDETEELDEGFKRSRVLDKIAERFVAGIGNTGQNFWHLFNAVTEQTTHGLGNKRKDDGPGAREARKLDQMFFGAGAALNRKAFQVAMKMAQASV